MKYSLKTTLTRMAIEQSYVVTADRLMAVRICTYVKISFKTKARILI
jgi:hypothetical protein